MKRFFGLFLLIGVAFMLGACNTPDGPTPPPPPPPPPVVITDGGVYALESGTDYVGAEVELTKFLEEGETLKDISQYASVTVDATLYFAYTDADNNTPATAKTATTDDGQTTNNQAQFKLLKATGGWDDANNVCSPTKYSMTLNGETTLTIPSTASGIPAILLLQANHKDFTVTGEQVTHIKINSIEFTPKSSGGEGGGELTIDHVYEIVEGSGYLGCQIDLAEWGPFLDIAQYASVIVDATLYFAYTDETTNTVATLPTGDNKNLAQFKLLKSSGGWDDDSNICSPTKYGMAVDGPTTLNIPANASGVPAFLLIQANHVDFSSPNAVTHIKVKTIEFVSKSEVNDNNVVLDWGSGYTTDVFPTNSEWPGRSIPLIDHDDILGTLGDISLYDRVIVDAVALDRDGNQFPANTVMGDDGVTAFFIILADNSDWGATSELVKQYDMNLSGETIAVRGTAQTFKNAGQPKYIAFLGRYKSEFPNSRMVGKVTIKKVTFVAKAE